MKAYLGFVLMLFFFSCDKSKKKSEIILTEDDFKEYIIQFKPHQREGVSEKDFEFGKASFERALNKINKDSFSIAANDYWALFLAQINLREPLDYTRYTFFKAYELNPEVICLVLQFQETDVNEGFKKIINIMPEIRKIVDTCQASKISAKDDTNLINYCEENELDCNLVSLFQRIKLTDQKYRENLETYRINKGLQDDIDNENQKIIDSLFKIHKEYIGKSYVGNKYNHVMWLVIQHSNLEKMKKYFPVIHQAVKKEELAEDAFKMLIDRMYNIEHDYQIFGSQAGVEIAPDSIRKKVVNELSF